LIKTYLNPLKERALRYSDNYNKLLKKLKYFVNNNSKSPPFCFSFPLRGELERGLDLGGA
jgi:hypothetical protein